MNFENNDYPTVYRSADQASMDAQKYYLWLVKIDLLLMVVAAILTTFEPQSIKNKMYINGTAALLFAIAFILSLVLRYNRFEKTWYGGRAVAESFKSLTWKYITKAKPFDKSDDKANPKFVELAKEILSDKKDLAFTFKLKGQYEVITQKMKDIRLMTTTERLDLYQEDRIQTQIQWYGSKSTYNKTRGNYYSGLALAFQFVGLAFVIYITIEPNTINFTGAISSVSVAFFSWMQIKKFQELAQAYALTANELGMAKAVASSINNDKDLSEYINDSESAISREHTMWAARRE